MRHSITLRQWLGLGMLALLFVGMFVVCGLNSGFDVALLVFGATALLLVWVAVAVGLMAGDLWR